MPLPFTPDALLLDLDGTLLDSEPWHKLAEILTFAKFGLELQPSDLMRFTGTTLRNMLEGVAAQWARQILVEEFLEVQKPLFKTIIEEKVELFPDALRFLERHSQVRKALVTSSLPWYLEVVSAKHPILIDAFELRICGADVENGKPHPEPFLLACERLGVSPSRTFAIEDSANGVRSAKAADCRSIGIDRGGSAGLEADLVVRSLDELG